MPDRADMNLNHQTPKVSAPPVPVARRPSTHWVLLAQVVYVGFAGVTCWQGRLFVGAGTIDWGVLRYPLLVGTTALVLAALLSIRMMGSSIFNSIGFLLITFGISWLAEFSGLNWGLPFGYRYHYHAALTPVLPGQVPLFIPLAWVVLQCHTIGPAEEPHSGSGKLAGCLRVGCCPKRHTVRCSSQPVICFSTL